MAYKIMSALDDQGKKATPTGPVMPPQNNTLAGMVPTEPSPAPAPAPAPPPKAAADSSSQLAPPIRTVTPSNQTGPVPAYPGDYPSSPGDYPGSYEHPSQPSGGGGNSGSFDDFYNNVILKNPGIFDTGISRGQWEAWEGLRDPNCPPDAPYRHERKFEGGGNIPGCEAKPVDCPGGYVAWDGSGGNFCIPENDPRAGGGGGGGGSKGGGGGGGGGGAGSGAGGSGGEAGVIWAAILERLLGNQTRYSPEVMASLMAQEKQGLEAQRKTLTDQAYSDQAARGVLRSPTQNAVYRDINATTSGQALTRWNEIQKAKIDADFQDKTEAIKEAMDWLNSLRDYTARMAGTKASYDVGMANVGVAQAQLLQQLQMMREGYAQQLQMWALNNG